jgi:hypothetical protein
MNDLKLAWTVLTNPKLAFEQLREQPRFIFPIALSIVLTALMLVWYYSIVDVHWLMDRMLSANPRTAQLSDAQRAQALARTSSTLLMWTSVVGVVLTVSIIYAVSAAYYLLAGKVTNVERRYSQWLAVVSWSALPQLFAVVAGLIMLAVRGSPHMDQTDLQVLSINELFTHLDMSAKGVSLLSSLTLLHPWVWALSVLGVRVLSDRSWTYSAIVGLLPSVLVYGCWAAIAFH